MGADHAARELMNRAKCTLLNRAPDPDSDGQPYSDNLTLIVLQFISTISYQEPMHDTRY